MKRITSMAVLGLVPVLVATVLWVRTLEFAVDSVLHNRPLMLQAYLLAGGDPNAQTPHGPLAYLATGPNGGEQVLDVLLKQGADPNIRFNGETPLMNAASWCALNLVQLLVQAGADLDLRNDRGQSAVDSVCSGPEYLSNLTIAYLRTAMAARRQPK